MKNCNNCIKQDVCNYYSSLLNDFKKILIPMYGGIHYESKELNEFKNLIGRHCKYYLGKENGKI